VFSSLLYPFGFPTLLFTSEFPISHSLHAQVDIKSSELPISNYGNRTASSSLPAPKTFNVLVAPPEMLIDAINNINLQHCKVLFVSGNYSRILSRLNRNIIDMVSWQT
jgi:hypothetical protein